MLTTEWRSSIRAAAPSCANLRHHNPVRPQASGEVSQQLIAEIQQLYDMGRRGWIFLVDDNFIGNKRNVKKAACRVAGLATRPRLSFHLRYGKASIDLQPIRSWSS